MMFDHLKRKAESAQTEYEAAHAHLFRDAAKKEKLYRDDEHEQRLRALHQERARKLDAVIEELRAETEQAQKDLAVLEEGDPTALLSGEELAAAGAKKAFADDEVQALPQDRLAGKLRAVLGGGDRAAVFAYWRAASDRYESIIGERGSGGASGASLAPRGLPEVLEEMRRFLAGPARLARAERAREKAAGALEVELLASNLKVGARSVGEAHTNRRYSRWGLTRR